MKTFRYLIVAVLFLLVAGTSSAQTREEKKEALKTYVGEQVNGRTFKLEASMAYPMSGRSIPLTTPYGLQMKKDSVDVYLPYYGRAYQIPYGGGEGLRFKAPVENYSSKLKKDRYRITFEATTSEDNFRFSVDLYDDGSANIHVTMRNRQPIHYTGQLDATELQ